MQRLNWHGGIFFPKLNKNDAAAGLQRASDAVHHRHGLRELVIDVDHQDQIDGVVRQFGISGGPENDVNVFQVPVGDVFPELRDHSFLDIFGDDFPGRPDDFSHPPTVIANAGSDVRDD